MPNPKKRAEKQEAASERKNAASAAKKSAEEDALWSQGAKGAGKADKEAERKAEAQRKKDEKASLAAAEDAENTKINKGGPKGKAAAKKQGGGIDDFLVTAGLAKAPPKKQPGLAASNIEDAIDALSLTNKASTISTADIDKHPERRYKAAYQAFEERRIAEMKEEGLKLRLQQMKEMCHKEFQKHPDNPFNQVTARHDATKDELKEIVAKARNQTESRLAVK